MEMLVASTAPELGGVKKDPVNNIFLNQVASLLNKARCITLGQYIFK